MRRLFPLTAAALALALAVPAAAQDVELWSGPALTTTPMAEADAAFVDQTVAATMADVPDLPGMWIGIWDPDKGYYTQAYGEAAKGAEPAAIDQHGRIGSVTKTFTTTAILQQVAAGNLSLRRVLPFCQSILGRLDHGLHGADGRVRAPHGETASVNEQRKHVGHRARLGLVQVPQLVVELGGLVVRSAPRASSSMVAWMNGTCARDS